MTTVRPTDVGGLGHRSDRDGHSGLSGRSARLFTQAALGYAAHRPGQTLALLQAGCTTAW